MYVGRAVTGEAPWYVDAYKGSFVGSIAIAFVQLLLGLVLPVDALWLTLGVSVVVGFPIYAVIFQMVIGYTLKQAVPVAGVAVVCSSIVIYGIEYFYPL